MTHLERVWLNLYSWPRSFIPLSYAVPKLSQFFPPFNALLEVWTFFFFIIIWASSCWVISSVNIDTMQTKMGNAFRGRCCAVSCLSEWVIGLFHCVPFMLYSSRPQFSGFFCFLNAVGGHWWTNFCYHSRYVNEVIPRNRGECDTASQKCHPKDTVHRCG